MDLHFSHFLKSHNWIDNILWVNAKLKVVILALMNLVHAKKWYISDSVSELNADYPVLIAIKPFHSDELSEDC